MWASAGAGVSSKNYKLLCAGVLIFVAMQPLLPLA
jgi:hypothetical protein